MWGGDAEKPQQTLEICISPFLSSSFLPFLPIFHSPSFPFLLSSPLLTFTFLSPLLLPSSPALLPSLPTRERKEGMLGSSHSWKVNFFAWWWSLRILYWSWEAVEERVRRSLRGVHSAHVHFGGSHLAPSLSKPGGREEEGVKEVGDNDRNAYHNE